MKKKVLFIFGTRPEAIKMAPVIKKFSEQGEIFETKVCVTAQHREMLDQVLDFFGIIPDYDLNLMMRQQDLFDITSKSLLSLRTVLNETKPDLVFVQGDTTTAFAGALAAYYNKIRVAHIEAGLRTFNKYSPFPEEINRKLISVLADIHFVPTRNASDNLFHENIKENIHNVGNTVIDALFLGLDIIKRTGPEFLLPTLNNIDLTGKLVLITGHRRENFGSAFECICYSIRALARTFPEVKFVYPVHLNPNVQFPVFSILQNEPNVHLVPPVSYHDLLILMERAYLILTDSGGIQEEAPSLKKPVLVMREVTERMEGIEAGNAKLVGTSQEKIVDEVSELLLNNEAFEAMRKNDNPYGDGKTSEKIFEITERFLG